MKLSVNEIPKKKNKCKRYHLHLLNFKKTSKSLISTNLFLPFEPTLFPKLQVYFADFPYLRYAIKTPEALNLKDLMRLSVRNGLKMNNNNTLFFMEQ